MLELKPLSPESIPRALEKAERYRLLNEPVEAASICQDVLRIDPENQPALITLVLALTDQFGDAVSGLHAEARDVATRLRDRYDQLYYRGIIEERRGKSLLRREGPGASAAGHECIRGAMECYEKAEDLRPPGNDDAVLRWNACARLLMRDHAESPAAVGERFDPLLE